MALILTLLMPKDEGIPREMFAMMFAPMFAGMMPIITMATVIGEEKEKKSLKVLAMSGVTPMEYLIGTGGFLVLASIPAILIFGLTAELKLVPMLVFFATMMLGILISTIIGSACGIVSKNQVNASAIALPFSLILAFIPMIAVFNEGVRKVGTVLFTQQISNILENMSKPDPISFLVMGINLIVALGFFVFAYKKGNMSE